MIKNFSDFYIGQTAIFKKVFKELDYKDFSKISGDFNSLHWDEEFAGKTIFQKPIVPLKLSCAPLSRVAGMIFPGKPSLFLTSNVKAIKPIFYDQEITYTARIESISESTNILGIRVLAFCLNEVLIDAFIEVKVLSDSWEFKKDEEVKFLSNQKVNEYYLVTGSTGEIGSAISLKLANEGYKLILLYRTDGDKKEELKNNLDKIKASYQFIKIDLNSCDFKKSFKEEFSKIKVLNGISGIVHTASPDIDEDLTKLVKVNYSSLVDITSELLPHMLIRQSSLIIFISSIAVFKQIEGWHDYIAAKTMATSFMSGLNLKYSKYGIKCTTIFPGFVQTKYSEKYRENQTALLPGELAEEITNLDSKNPPEIIRLEVNNRQCGTYSAPTFYPSSNVIDKKSTNLYSKKINSENLDEIEDYPNIRNKLNNLFKKYLNIDESLCNEFLSIENNPKWDSLTHFQLIASIENAFSIKFTSSEISSLTNYSSLCKRISEKF